MSGPDRPNFEIADLDFSEYHPLDHRPWRCGDLPGGWRRHVHLAWEYKWRSQLRAATLCRLGLHQMTNWFNRDWSPAGRSCEHCHAPAKPSGR